MASRTPISLYAGLMSGTSMDGVDAVLLQIDAQGCQIRAATHTSYPEVLASRLRELIVAPHAADVDALGELDAEVGGVFAQAAQSLLAFSGYGAADVRAIGSHGQTIRHRPQGAPPFTLQIGDPNLIAERTGIDVVADFRRRDMAAGGEAAPLVPAFHADVFGSNSEDRAVVNIGGIANITRLPAGGPVSGFDTGPGNCLMDLWSRLQWGKDYDADGIIAAQGSPQPQLLARLLAEPYFHRPAPKSTGRELFNEAFLKDALQGLAVTPVNVQATLCELTATTIAQAVLATPSGTPRRVLVCGGGANNSQLMRRLAAALPGIAVDSTASHGIAPTHVEGAAFAWLAHRFLERLPGNLPAVTGARGPRVLGALYPGGSSGGASL